MTNGSSVTVICLVLLLVILFIVTAPKVARAKINARDLSLFVITVVVLTTIRMTIMLYVQHRVQNHTFSENVYYLTYLLYPELPMASVIPTESYYAYLSVRAVALLLGGVLWSFPLLFFWTLSKQR